MRAKKEKELSPDEWQQRFDEAAESARREYCDLFALWRGCRYKPCRRARTCSGEAKACLAHGIERVPATERLNAAARVIAATPAGADAPTQTARRLSAHTLAI